MRACASFLVVELMRAGKNVTEACQMAVDRVVSLTRRRVNELSCSILAVDVKGNVGGASTICEGNKDGKNVAFPYVTGRYDSQSKVKLVEQGHVSYHK